MGIRTLFNAGLRSKDACVFVVVLSASLAVVSSVYAADLTNLIAHWNFEETSGFQLADSTGNHDAFTVGPVFEDDINNPGLIAISGGTITDVLRFEGSANAGAIGNAWSFPGNNGFDEGDVGVQPVNPAVFTSLGPSYTFSVWFNSDIDLATTDDTPSTLFSISNNDPNNTPNVGREVLIRLNDDDGIPGATVGGAHYLARADELDAGDPLFGINRISATTDVQVDTSPAVWHHVAVAQSSTGWQMYLDGVLNNSGPEVVSPSAINANVVNIGRNDDDFGFGGVNGLGNPYDPGEWTFGGDPAEVKPNIGLLDDISIWDTPLTAQEVSNIYNGGLTGLEAPQAISTSPGTPGDYNGNDIVDAADYSVWLDNLGSTTDLEADGDNSGTVDAADYDVWKANFGTVATSSGEPTGAAVPEPGALLLSVVTMFALIALRKRGSK